MKLVLASNSPRRKEILKEFGFEFTVTVSGYKEDQTFTSPKKTVKEFSFNKAQEVFFKLKDKEAVVLGADTIVYYGGKILGKPKNQEDAVKILKALSGRTHSVFTGYAIISEKGIKRGVVETKVTFNALSDSLIEEYVKTGSPLDKAGAYGIQDGFNLVKNLRGSYYNVVGLPIEKIQPILKKYLWFAK